MEALASSRVRPMPVRTWEGSTAPEEQAAPEETAKAAEVEGDDHGFAFDAGEEDVGRCWKAGSAGAVDGGVGDAGEDALFKLHGHGVEGEGIAGEFAGGAEGDAPGTFRYRRGGPAHGGRRTGEGGA
jgi:hypothetical protein